jgi:single-strand DNA-binding protein
MSSVNRVILVGNLGKDPEVKEANGKTFAKFSLATSVKFKDQEKTTWHNVIVWNENNARFIGNYAVKGTKVYVEGTIDNRSYEKDGITRYTSDVVVGAFDGTIRILSDGKGRGEKQTDNSAEYAKQSGAREDRYAPPLDDDEAPF